MKFTSTQENLNQGLMIVSHIAAKTTSLPILNNVLIKAGGGVIQLETTNLELGVTCQVRGKVEAEGSFTVGAKLFADYVNLLPRENVNIELNDQTLKVSCKNYQTKINGAPAEDFPLIPQLEKKEPAKLKIADFKKALSQVVFAAALDETRPEINGVFLNFKGNKLTLAATDSYRLAEKVLNLDQGLAGDKNLIVPLRTFQELQRILTDGLEGDTIEIYLGDNQILFLFNGVELISRLVEGKYPDYKQIIPTDFKTTAVASVSELAKVIKTASLFCRTGINDINLKVIPNKVTVSSANSQLGENRTEIETETSGDDNEIVFNFRYLLDGLNNIDTNEVELKIIDPNSPGLLKSREGQDYVYIVMPIKQ
ncbi:MAG TPA: DNA polymerase III subunit beta [Patescibacteria group bacterium]